MCQNVNKQTDNGINQTNNYYLNYDDNSLDEHDHCYDRVCGFLAHLTHKFYAKLF